MKLPGLPKFDIRYIYVLYTYSHLYRFKCGISNNVQARRAQIEQELSRAMHRNVKVRIAVYVPSLFAEHQEAKIHRWLAPIRDKGMTWHAGYSEWFWMLVPNFLLACIVWIVCYSNGIIIPAWVVAAITFQPIYPVLPALLVIGVMFVGIFAFLAACLLIGAVLYYGVNIIHT